MLGYERCGSFTLVFRRRVKNDYIPVILEEYRRNIKQVGTKSEEIKIRSNNKRF
jgi:hypothetical protein